jgi:hypothetical protein
LRARNYRVLVDADELRPGDEWRLVLYSWLAECHAAVLLLSKEALNSPWVRRETTILMWRHLLGPTVHVVPALVGDVTARDVAQAGFGELGALQYARLAKPGSTPAHARELASAIAGRFAVLPEPSLVRDPMQVWLDRVTYFLTHVGDDDSLSEAGRELGISDDDLSLLRLPEGRRFFAHQLLSHDLSSRTYKAIRAISDYMSREWLDKLIRDISFVWVHAEAARQLLSTHQPMQGGVALLNARSAQTVDDYIERATFRGDYLREVAGTAVGEDAVAELVAHYEKAVERLLGVEPPWTLADATPRDQMCVLTVDPAGVRLEVVASAVRIIQERYPWLVTVLMTGEAVPDNKVIATWSLGRVRVLTPQLAAEEEFRARRLVADLNRFGRM